MSEDAGRLDFLILGATGFTGLHCIPYAHKFSKDGRKLTWGISGRSEEKLKEILQKMGRKIGADLSRTPVIIADVKNDESLVMMAQKTKVVINCCGPFVLLGEPVVKACIEAGTHYIDVSGEPQYLETVQLKYHEAAREKGIYIVGACGLDSIPNDLGLVFLKDKFDGTLNSVVSYLNTWVEGENYDGPVLNYGTWETFIYALSHARELASVEKKLFPKKLPTFTPKLRSKILPHRPRVVEGWAVPFPGTDLSVMKRTERYLYENENKRPVQVDTQLVFTDFLTAIHFIFLFLVCVIFAQFNWSKRLLLNYPHIFSNGLFRKDQQPPEEVIERIIFQLTFYGEGWSEKLTNKNDKYNKPPNNRIVGRVKGRNPGYGTTCICLVGAAIMITTEKNKLPNGGGVYTPGAAFGKTSLIKFLHQNEVTFDILSQKDL